MGRRHHSVVAWGIVMSPDDDFAEAKYGDLEVGLDLDEMVGGILGYDDTPLEQCHVGYNEDDEGRFFFAASTKHYVGLGNDIPWNMSVDTSGGPTDEEREAMREFIEAFDLDVEPEWRLNGSQQ